jgi:hypothetical protein
VYVQRWLSQLIGLLTQWGRMSCWVYNSSSSSCRNSAA